MRRTEMQPPTLMGLPSRPLGMRQPPARSTLMRLQTVYLSALLTALALSGCVETTTSGDDDLDALIERVARQAIGSDASTSWIDCPDLEGVTPGDYDCTSTVDGEEVEWDIIVETPPSASGDSVSVTLTPHFESSASNAEFEIRRQFVLLRNLSLESVTCPESSSEMYAGACQAEARGISFGVQFTDEGNGRGVVRPLGVITGRQIEIGIAQALEENGTPSRVECDIPDIANASTGDVMTCLASSTVNREQATIQVDVTSDQGNYSWNIVDVRQRP